MARREKNRDDREYDTTQLHEAAHGQALGRDYSAHFFRWSFAKRWIKPTDDVLDVGCGQERPLSKILVGGANATVNHYTGVDLNKLKPTAHQRLTLHGEFNFNERYQELLETQPDGFDVITHFEIIEHMHSTHQLELMQACYACLKPGGVLLMSTPVYDHVRHAANHIKELDVPELQALAEEAGFVVERRFGTFMDIKHIGKASTGDDVLDEAVNVVFGHLTEYYMNDAASNIFAPLYPDHSRNNLWICRKGV